MSNSKLYNEGFSMRHIGPSADETNQMLDTIGVSTIDTLIDEVVPSTIRLKQEPNIGEAVSEYDYLRNLEGVANKNQMFRSFIGMGYYRTFTPSVIKRNIFENPGWYTQYTPYQAEISQGRLEALLNFQTMISDLTALPIANASLLDEGTAAAEAMIMFFNTKNKREIVAPKFFVDNNCYPQTVDVIKTRAIPLNIEVVTGDWADSNLDDSYFGALVQYPDGDGAVHDYKSFAEEVHSNNAYLAVAADIMSLNLLTPPGEWGADAVVGISQRFGVPMGYGGPHAAYFATTENFKRLIPGRIIGVSVDSDENPAYRMALQTREQHIRREKATSNICTAQALLAIMAGMYAAWHGANGLKNIATSIATKTNVLAEELNSMGYTQVNPSYFDTIKIGSDKISEIHKLAEQKEINFRHIDSKHLGISLDECTTNEDLQDIINIFAEINGMTGGATNMKAVTGNASPQIPENLQRSSDVLTHPVFNSYRSETDMMRYIKSLENKDLSLTSSMIPLGSCTMKLNAASELFPVSWPQFAHIHPFVPKEQTEGYQTMITELEKYLCEITGFTACSLQPNSGAQGEYAGLMVIRQYHLNNGDDNRDVVLIPSSAHGTNPASGIMAGMKVVVVACDEMGNIDVEDLKAKASEYKESLSALMVTYPSTHGVFESSIIDICNIVHENGGMVYMDGANMNAQVGLTSPANIGADVCHLNLHKTFAIPHGGGGPGMGPICCNDKLKAFLPGHPIISTGGDQAIGSISAAPYGSSSILLISYAYIKMLGTKGVTNATQWAILNANYLKTRLENHFDILYTGNKGRVAHEFILDCRGFKQNTGIEVEDIAKRLMDYNFHAPTVSFPVAGTLMIEPTESESKPELDRFCEAMIAIRSEISKIEDGTWNQEDNPIKNAPHTSAQVMSDSWTHTYSRQEAAFPLSYLKDRKFWTPVARINNSYGDRNLICTCPPMESYEEVGSL